jgi:hypothetical protein
MSKLEDLLWWHVKKIVDQNNKGVWDYSIWIFKTRLLVEDKPWVNLIWNTFQ